MDWRTKRQLTILFIVVGVIVLILGSFGFAIFYKPGSCVDGRKNQNEEEVDCGGLCAPCAFKHQQAIQIFYAIFVQTRPQNYDIVAQVGNPNEKLAANPLAYRVHLFDDQGAEVGRRDGQTYIYPNDRNFVVESNFITARTVKTAEIEVLNDQTNWQYTNNLYPQLTLGNKNYQVITVDNQQMSYVSADLTNREQIGFASIDVRVALLNKDGNIVGVAKTVVSRLTPGESRKVEFTWPNVITDTVDQIELEARANALETRKLLSP